MKNLFIILGLLLTLILVIPLKTYSQGSCLLQGFNAINYDFFGPFDVSLVTVDLNNPSIPNVISAVPVNGNLAYPNSAINLASGEQLCILPYADLALFYDGTNFLSHNSSGYIISPQFLNGIWYVVNSTVVGGALDLNIATYNPNTYFIDVTCPSIVSNYTGYAETISSTNDGVQNLFYLDQKGNLYVINPLSCTIQSFDLTIHNPAGTVWFDFIGIEFKEDGKLYLVRMLIDSFNNTSWDLIEITFDPTYSNITTFQPVLNLNPILVGWGINPEFYSSFYDKCNKIYGISTPNDFDPPKSYIHQIDLKTNSPVASSDLVDGFVFGLQSLQDVSCCPPPSNCCVDLQNFQDKVADLQQEWNQVTTDPTDCFTYTVSLTLPECYGLLTATPDWGDGNVATGGHTFPNPAGSTFSWTHTYTQPGIYNICIEVAEFIGGQICTGHQETLCVQVMVDDLSVNTFYINDATYCDTPSPILVPIISNSICINTQVEWFARECGTSNPFTHYFTNTGLASFPVYPASFSTNCIEVFAKVHFDGSATCCGLTVYETNIAVINFCSPVICTLNHQNLHYCASAPPIELVASLSASSCIIDIEWFHNGAVVPGINTNTYTTPDLQFTGQPNECVQLHTFTARITSTCGIRECSAFIRVFNPNVNTGSLTINPNKELPLCHGDDATVVFSKGNCIHFWKWYINNVPNPVDNSDYDEMTQLGQNNLLLNTNILTETTWYRVVGNNGPCTTPSVNIEIPVKNVINIVDFTITNDPCMETLDFVLDFTPAVHPGPSNCHYEVDWLFNGVLHGTYQYSASPATLSVSVNSNDLYGNFQAIIKDICCNTEYSTNVITVDPVCEPVVSGPCYRCYDDSNPIILEASMMLPNGLPCNTTCTFQWLDEDFNPIPGTNSLTYISNVGGWFYFQSDCNGCIKTTSIYVADCYQQRTTNIEGLETNQCYNINIFPNPNKGTFTIKIDPEPLKGASIKVFDMQEKQVFAKDMDDNLNSHEVRLEFLPSGFYYIQVLSKNLPMFSRKILIVK